MRDCFKDGVPRVERVEVEDENRILGEVDESLELQLVGDEEGEYILLGESPGAGRFFGLHEMEHGVVEALSADNSLIESSSLVDGTHISHSQLRISSKNSKSVKSSASMASLVNRNYDQFPGDYFSR